MAIETYQGGCQCGSVRYEVQADLDQTISCNCSRCGKLGAILSFAPEENFTLLSGEDSLSEYLFNSHTIHHLFCRTCGIQPFARGSKPDGAAMIAVNARCLDGVDPQSLNPIFVDGKSH